MKQVATSLPAEILAEIDHLATQRYTTRAEMMREAIVDYVDRIVMTRPMPSDSETDDKGVLS